MFQWGWLRDVDGIERTGPIMAFLSMMLFAIFFGLSMDYEVFLVSRIREEYEFDGDATVVRMLIVPAALSLFGDAAWWLSPSIERVLPRIAVEPAESHSQSLLAASHDGTTHSEVPSGAR